MAPIRVTVATPDGQASLLSVEPTAKVSSIAHALQDALAIPPAEQSLSFNGAPLPPDQTFHAACVADGDLILVERVPTVGVGVGVGVDSRSRTRAGAGAMEPRAGGHTGSTLVEGLRADPAILAQLRTGNPPLYDAVNAGNEALVHDLMQEMQELQRRQQPQQQASASHGSGPPPRTDAASGGDHLDPMSAEAQAHIAERIRMENVIRNLEDAFEHNPESFAQVVMLFVDVKLNGHPTTAFVDSGAQATIVSKACAERCGILRLLDTRFSGVARGVGTATIFGRIHLALLDVAGQFFEVSLTVMEDPSYDMLLGLDMLRKHQASIDLSGNCLRIGGTSTPFLPEHKIPRNMRTIGDGQPPPEESSRGNGGSAVSVGTPGQNGSTVQGSATSAGMDPLRAAESRLHRAKIENPHEPGIFAQRIGTSTAFLQRK